MKLINILKNNFNRRKSLGEEDSGQDAILEQIHMLEDGQSPMDVYNSLGGFDRVFFLKACKSADDAIEVVRIDEKYEKENEKSRMEEAEKFIELGRSYELDHQREMLLTVRPLHYISKLNSPEFIEWSHTQYKKILNAKIEKMFSENMFLESMFLSIKNSYKNKDFTKNLYVDIWSDGFFSINPYKKPNKGDRYTTLLKSTDQCKLYVNVMNDYYINIMCEDFFSPKAKFKDFKSLKEDLLF